MRIENLLALVLGTLSCGGGASSAPPPEPPSAATHVEGDTPSLAAATAAPSAAEPAPAATPPPIEFPPHAGVEAAMKAVPQGSARLNMSDEALRTPLLDMTRYEKCKVPRSTKVSLNVAVYDGRAVGVDVTSKPKNAKISDCLDGVVRGITWDKVPSLNQVNVNF